MEALYLGSRSSSHDRLLQKRLNRQYSQHIKTIQTIGTQKLQPIRSNDKMAKTLKRYKETSRNFHNQEATSERKKSNRKLVEKLWTMESTMKNRNPQFNKLHHMSGNNWHYRNMKAESIKQENKKLGMSLISQREEILGSHKRIKKEIDSYLVQRENIRKFRFDANNRSPRNKPGFLTTNFQQLHQIKFMQPIREKLKRKK